MKTFFPAILAGLALVACVNSVFGDTNLLENDNYSFEDPVIATTPNNNGGQYVITNSIPDWTFSAAGGDEATGIQTISSAFDSAGTSDGLNYALLNIQQNGPASITYDGTGADALPIIAADTDYTLTVAVGNRTAGFNSSALGGTDTVDLLAGTSAFGTTVNETQITPDTFTDETVTLSAATILADNLVGQSLGIELIGSQYGSDGFDQATFDNVRLTETTVAAPVLATLYYDTNGATPGTATGSTQKFTDSVWTTDSTGSSATTGYIPSSDVVFSAGSNGTGTQAVTITDTELVHSFTFNNGIVTLLGSGNPNLHIETGGLTVRSNDGATTFDPTLGTITLDVSQSWNNDSTQALNVNAGVTTSGSTLSFAGTGTGNFNLNGQLTGGLSLTQNSATSTVYLNNTNNTFTGPITVNGGGLVFANEGSLNNNSITLSNGGVLESANEVFSEPNDDITNTITLGPGGGVVSGGVVGSYGDDTIFSGSFTGGTGLSVVNGDFITQTDGISDVGTLNIMNGSRLLAGSAGIFGNNAVVNVASILDFGWDSVINGAGVNYGGTLNNTINLSNGGAIENRGPGMNLTDVVFPTGTATVTLGSDDVGGGSITVGGPGIDLVNGTTLTIIANARSYGFTEYNDNPNQVSYNGANTTAIFLGENITGSGNLILDPETDNIYDATAKTAQNTPVIHGTMPGYGSPLYLTGDNSGFAGTTTINNLTVYPDSDGFGSAAASVILNSATIQTTGGTLANSFFSNAGNNYFYLSSGTETLSGSITVEYGTHLIFAQSGTSALTVSGPIDVKGGGTYLNAATLEFENYSSANLTVGSIDLKAYPTDNDAAIYFDAYGTGNITLAGTYTSAANSPPGSIGGSTLFLGYNGGSATGTYYIAPSANLAAFEPSNIDGKAAIWMFSGNLYLQNSSFVPGQIIAVDGTYSGGVQSVNIVGAQDINASIYAGGVNQFVVAQTTPDETIFAGTIEDFGTTMVLSAVDGSRLDITGQVSGSTTYAFVKTGGGTVELSDPSGANLSNNTSVVADIQEGTLIVNSPAGSSYGLGFNGGTVNIEKGATFAGNASLTSAQSVVSENAGSIIAPGEPGQASLGITPTIGTMTLPGGIVTANNADPTTDGMTMDFKLNGYGSGGGNLANTPGANNDFIQVGNLTLNGTITINLTAVGTVPLLTGYGNFYILIEGTGVWTGNPTFVVNAPAGYALDPSFGTPDSLGDGNDLGYVYDTNGDTFAVQLIAVPEPSVCGLLGLGLLALVAIGRVDWRKSITGGERSP